MLDSSLCLQENPQILALLSNYAQLGTEDHETWRDRLMQMDSVAPKQLSVLHGELIALDWIEQNSGQAIPLKDGTLSACYRITPQGLREYRRFHGIECVVVGSESPQKSKPKFPRKKKAEPEAPVIVTSALSPSVAA
jgi:hypothetical protein